MRITCRLPGPEDEALMNAYVRSHQRCGESAITAGKGIENMPFGEWIKRLESAREAGDGEWGRSELYLCMDGDALIGLLNIRCELPEEMRWIYGDVGYGVRPEKRRQGYATEILKAGMDICRQKKMDNIIVGCFKDNVGSAKTIRSNGGELVCERDSYEKGRMSQYYRIRL